VTVKGRKKKEKPRLVTRHYIYERCCRKKTCDRNKFVEEYIEYWEELHPSKQKKVHYIEGREQMKKTMNKIMGAFCWSGTINENGEVGIADLIIVDEFSDGFRKVLVPSWRIDDDGYMDVMMYA
jgi:hypothetical protein